MIDKKLVLQINTVLSKEPQIKLAYVLGSAVSGRIKKDSDFDLVVVLENADKMDYDHIYNLVFPVKFPKDLDLSIVDRASSPIFLFQIVSTGQCVYQRSAEEKVEFEASILKNYYDNAHLRKTYFIYLKDKFSYAN